MNKVIAALGLILFLTPCFGIDVEEQELTSVRLGSVEFLNYEGPHSKIETREQIEGIGRFLGGDFSRESVYAGKYRILRAFLEDTVLLNADIFVVEAGAQVDHIDNIRRIISSYLQTTYDYSVKDADLLAEFCSYYNAVYRGNMDYVSSKYHTGVVSHLSAANMGIATSYREWPGKTRMLIPLKGSGKIDADVISDENVVEKLREEEDKGIPERKELVEYKEKEIEEYQEQIDTAREEIDTEKKTIAREEQEIEEDKAVLEEQKETLEPEEAARQEEEIAEKEKELEQRRETVAEKEAEVEEKEEEQRSRVERIQEERAQIAADQQELIEDENAQSATAVVRGKEILFLKKNSDSRDAPGTLVFLNTATGRETRASSVTTIHSPTTYSYGRDILVVAGEEEGNRAIRLVLIDPVSLEMKQQGDSDMYPASFLLVDGEYIYGVVKEGSEYYIGRFDKFLGRNASSRISVLPNTWMKIDSGQLFVQTAGGVKGVDAMTLMESE